MSDLGEALTAGDTAGGELGLMVELERLRAENATLRQALKNHAEEAAKIVSAEPVAWLITGSRIFKDTVVSEEEWADRRIAERGKNDQSVKVPLYRRPQA